ncbi:pyridoxal phosphate enzyme, YggS family [Acidocella aminolytica 101 = DSM 11237]|nr:pyridoxal phosphate enzyme, YggS family [Acidocella aminolytica 101 = DSM 11237]
MKTSSAPARRARRICASLCTEALTSPPCQPVGRPPCPPRRCTPACRRAASFASPAIISASRRARQSRAAALAKAARCGCESCRSSTPHKPGGKRLIIDSGSGARASSVKNQSGGGPAWRRFTARAQAINRESMSDPSLIARNLETIRTRIATAARNVGRDPEAITLIAVSKTHPKEAVLAAMAAGASVFGENRVQEAASKFPIAGAKLHIIGGLQTNKAEQAVRLADSIDSLDRPRLADAIARAAEAAGRLPELLVQVNIGDEPQKSGIPTAEADAFIRLMRARFGTALQGLMCIPPAEGDPTPFFHKLAAMADTHGLPVRSMGMSGDYESAIAAGATHIRIGTAIFGHRDLPA